MSSSNTALVLDPFLEGMITAGARVELFYTSALNINPCRGQFHCWLRNPGQCSHQDDMQMLLPKIAAADVLVLASPVYVDGVTGQMKNLLDRMIPLLQPNFELRRGHSRHQLRDGVKLGKLVLVSNCGFWEMDNFNPLLIHMAAFCRNMDMEFAGALLRPHGPALSAMLEMNLPMDDILQAAQAAGYQMVKYGRMSPETLKMISRELLPLEMYLEIGNQQFRKMSQIQEVQVA